jgi:selenocysteine-specific elongation factor
VHVIATAGHVDHGKSTLIRALTGMDPDRLAEEHRRQLTIELGFAWTTLPDVGQVAFVDVPGHERFVTTTLAGVGPVPAVLFVVAADEGWMAQSEEHLDALAALGVSHGVLVVTRCDLADPGPATEQARNRLATTPLRGIPAVTVSGVTGARMDDLRRAIAALVSGLPAPDLSAPVRLWLDRSFTIRGAGTVVTGTLAAGTISLGDTLASDTGRVVHVRGIETLGESPRPRRRGRPCRAEPARRQNPRSPARHRAVYPASLDDDRYGRRRAAAAVRIHQTRPADAARRYDRRALPGTPARRAARPAAARAAATPALRRPRTPT